MATIADADSHAVNWRSSEADCQTDDVGLNRRFSRWLEAVARRVVHETAASPSLLPDSVV